MTKKENGNLNHVDINDFCAIVSDKKLKGSGLVRGDVVMVAAFKPAPTSKKDPYIQRIFALVFLVKDNELQVPKDDNENKAYLIDPRTLETLPEDQQEAMLLMIKRQYGYEDTTTH